MRELVRARSTFREASLDVTRDPTVAAASRQLDAVLGAQQRRNRPWEFQLTLGYEWDSNVIELGSNIPTPAGISNQSDFRGVVQPRGSYSFFRQDKWDMGLEGAGYFAWQQELNDFDTESYSGGPFLNYHLTPNLYASARYGYNLVRVGHDSFLTQHVVTPQLTYIEPKFGYTSGYYQFQSRNFADDPTGPSAPLNRDGTNHIVGIVQGIDLPSFFKDAGAANLELSYRFERQETTGADFDGYFNSVGATIYTPLPLGKLRADVGVNLSYDNYDNPNSLDAVPQEPRQDWEFAGVVGLTREIFKGCALRVDYSYTDHHSNVVDPAGLRPYQFDRNQIGTRLIFSY
jgi:outer membrane protein assembly factor BamA